MGYLRGQSGTEYLSNYTIAGVVVIIIIAALFSSGVLDSLFNPPEICVFQKGIQCESHYLKKGDPAAKLTMKNQFDDAIVISGVICSAQAINPSTALPVDRVWNDPLSAPLGTTYPSVNGQHVSSTSQPFVLARESFELKVVCYQADGSGFIDSLPSTERFKGIVFIQYRLNSSPNIPGSSFMHVIQGNLQGKPN